ncbi:MAG: GTP cyclohydrolase II [Deltaproteobacteria bacterium CG2_30_63_29]|nr:MAG: GTP cyclohydrolase II [Deltaproteobacteria bacterium CG2_30_63_29]PJB41287.1 MAG: GTP cyclohydrolase II [Deltaproteobacteria bacterium CG_4_9_14_3_um_filter_63_12]
MSIITQIQNAFNEVTRPLPDLSQEPLSVEIVAEAKLPTRYGHFRIVAFRNNKDHKDHVALIHGDVNGAENVPTRLHSECLTGDVFGSLRCDCRQQLEVALEQLGDLECGLILYMRQEGRGIGLANKIAAYALQDTGLDTVEANYHLGFDDDLREYDVAARMFDLLGVESVNLMTNNPKKIVGLEENGVTVCARTPILVPANPHNQRYLTTKKKKSGHLLGLSS